MVINTNFKLTKKTFKKILFRIKYKFKDKHNFKTGQKQFLKLKIYWKSNQEIESIIFLISCISHIPKPLPIIIMCLPLKFYYIYDEVQIYPEMNKI